MIVDNSHVFLQFSELGVHVQSEANQEIELISWDKIKKKEFINKLLTGVSSKSSDYGYKNINFTRSIN